MRIRRYALSLVTATTIALGALTAPAAQAYELTVEGDVCTYAYTPADTLQLEGVMNESFVNILTALQADIPGVSIDDLALLSEYIGNGLFSGDDASTVESFAGTPVADTAVRVNAAAVAAGFHDNEVFLILRYAMWVSFAAVVVLVYMPTEGTGEPEVLTREEARERLAGSDLDEDEFYAEISVASAPGTRNLALVKDMFTDVLDIFQAPLRECVGEDPNPGGDDTNPGGDDTNPGGDDTNPGGGTPAPGDGQRGGSLSSFGSS